MRLYRILAVTFLAGAGMCQALPAAEPIRIGATFPLSGNAASFGQLARQGAELAVAEVNAAGGISGRTVELVVEDNRCNPTEGVRAVTQMLADPSFVAMFDGFCSSVVLAIMPLVDRAAVPLIVTASATSISEMSGIGGNTWTFKVTPTDDMLAQAVVAWLDESGMVDRIAFLGEDTDFGRAGLEGFRAALAAGGHEFASEDLYQQGTADFSAVLTKLKSLEPSALALYSVAADQKNIVSQMAAYGVVVPLTGKLQTDVMPEEVLASGMLDGSVSVQPYSPEIDTPMNRGFVEAYSGLHGSAPNSIPYTTYEAMRVLLDAIARADALEPSGIRDALATTSLPSLLGDPITFDDHNLAHGSAVILRIEGGIARVVGLSKT